MSNTTINTKIFTAVLRKTKEFTLRMSGFAVTTALSILIQLSTINLDFVVKQLLRQVINIRISTIIMNIIPQFITRIPLNLSGGKVNLSFIMTTINKLFVTMTSKIDFSFITRFLRRNTLNFTTGKIILSTNPVVAILIKLFTLDPQLLDDLDSLNLEDLDHS